MRFELAVGKIKQQGIRWLEVCLCIRIINFTPANHVFNEGKNLSGYDFLVGLVKDKLILHNLLLIRLQPAVGKKGPMSDEINIVRIE